MACKLTSRGKDSQAAPSAAKADFGNKPVIAALKRCATQKQMQDRDTQKQGLLGWRWLAGLVLLWGLPLGAQVQYGDLHGAANGEITAGYTGDYGNQEASDHSLGFGGDGTINGYYYNPKFLTFAVSPFYGRSQENSESQSITDASGYGANFGIFNGSHFPGYVNFSQNWNGTGTFGIPGVAGLTTKNYNRGINLGWNELVPGLPTLMVGFSDTSGSSSLLGSDESSASTNRNFTVGSAYRLAGFDLNGGYTYATGETNLAGILENGETETTDFSSDRYYVNATHKLPIYNGQIAGSFSRGTYNSDDSIAGQQNGTTDSASLYAGLPFPKLPVTVAANYTDNIFGSFQQQLVSSGQAPLPGLESPESRSLSVTANTSYQVLPNLSVSGYVDRTEQYFEGQSYGLTQIGLNASYNFFRHIKGLTVLAGVVDSADQQGNTHVGFVGGATYNRSLGRWEVGAYVQYAQDVQTLLVEYTASTLSYGATVKRVLPHNLRWISTVAGGRTVFEEQSGNGSHSETFTSMLIARRFALSGNYSQSEGTSILTASGLVATPVPGQALSPSNFVVYNGKSDGVSLRFDPMRNLLINLSYSKASSDSTTPLLFTNFGSTNYFGLLQYRLRKLEFVAGFTKFQQSFSGSGLPPAVVNSFYFGITRWFKGF
ncbi:MAG: hypothetical protein WCA13_04100 [Terriglobales bacterium]